MKLDELIDMLQDMRKLYGNLTILVASDEEGNSLHQLDGPEWENDDYIILWPGGMEVEL